MKHKLLAILLIIISFYGQAQDNASDKVFVAEPYLQIGSVPTAQSLQLLWHAADSTSTWVVEYKDKSAKVWTKSATLGFTKVAVSNIAIHFVYRAALTGLVPGSTFLYKVSRNGKQVFAAEGKASKEEKQPYRFVVFGDVGAGTPEAKQIANGVYNANADLILIPGDIVYDNGLISEYRSRFWPIYNADKVDSVGVPLMRSIPFVSSVGNHDADSRDLDRQPDALAYYHYWDQPLNGIQSKEGSAMVPVLKGSDANKKAFLEGAGNRYPSMSNFSFNYGNAHWLILDADNYVDWTDKELTAWVAKDLADAKDATWRFVMYHHPGFNSSRAHFEQQQMRLLSPVFEAGKVDVVFSGHVHNYQRSYPMFFKPDNKGILLTGGKDNKSLRGRLVIGNWKLDKTFDGKTNTEPKGVIYVVTGAGGQDLYNPEQETDQDSWQPFTAKFISTVHTLTIADINAKELTIQQVDANGKVLDAFKITKK